MKFRFDTKFKTFKPVLHLKDAKDDENKNNFSYIKEKETVESIIILSYNSRSRNQNEDEVLAAGKDSGTERRVQSPEETKELSDSRRDQNGLAEGGISSCTLPKMKEQDQYLKLYTIAYKQIQDFKVRTKDKDYQLTQSIQDFKFKDERLRYYYDGLDSHNKKKQILTIQRVEDSPIYIILFPTGLLMHMTSILPLTIESKIQLNLKEGETIIDVKYCCSPDNLS